MSTANAIPVRSLSYAPPRFCVRLAKLHMQVLLEVVICVVPAMTLVGFGALYAGSIWLFGSVLLFMAHNFIARQQADAVALVVALVPAMMLLRGAFFYSALIAIPAAAVVIQLTVSPGVLMNLKGNKLLVAMLSASVIYWWASFVQSGDYASNIRVLELSFTAANIYLLANQRSYLATAIMGLAISTLCVAAGLLPYGDRLGIGRIGDISIGNPIALGLAATLVFLMTIVDRGQWLLVEKHPAWQVLLAASAAGCLVLSTSRGSWLVTIVGLLVILVFNRESRTLLARVVLAFIVLIVILLQTERGPVIAHYFENAVSPEQSLAKRTTGRADQWEAFPRVLGDSPIWGFGPGSGKAVSLRYTKEGKPWHSLYLLVGTETGIAGLVGLALLLGTLTRRGLVHWRRCGEVGPLLALVSFMVIGLSVSGADAISGVFLGLAFLGGEFSSMGRLRQVATPEGLVRRQAKPAVKQSRNHFAL
jgi:O-antigen ligase